jgi:hypothetical protein
VLLVKNKDGSYHFSVNFGHLNVLTIKSKFPLPIFDYLMDELAQLSMFLMSDLRVVLCQILLQLGDEFRLPFRHTFVKMSSMSGHSALLGL